MACYFGTREKPRKNVKVIAVFILLNETPFVFLVITCICGHKLISKCELKNKLKRKLLITVKAEWHSKIEKN